MVSCWTFRTVHTTLKATHVRNTDPGSPPAMAGPISAVRNPLKRSRDVGVQPGLVANVDLEPVRMRIHAARMSHLGAAGDDQGAYTRGVSQGYDAVDCAGENPLVGCAGGSGSVTREAEGRLGGADRRRADLSVHPPEETGM